MHTHTVKARRLVHVHRLIRVPLPVPSFKHVNHSGRYELFGAHLTGSQRILEAIYAQCSNASTCSIMAYMEGEHKGGYIFWAICTLGCWLAEGGGCNFNGEILFSGTC